MKFGTMILACILSFNLLAVPQVINIGNGAEPKDLDPHTATGIPEFHIILNIFEPLLSGHPKTLKPVPGVAESWTKSKDGMKYSFKLRKDSKWSNGDPVTASDFVYSWTRLLTPEVASEYATHGYFFKNGKAFNTGKLKDPKQLGFRAIDDYTLEVNLENPTPFFEGLLFHHAMYPVHKATVEKHGLKWTRPENIVTNGAFVLAKWEMNQIVTLKPSPNYWNRKIIKLEEANFFPVEKLDTEEKMFRSKQLHITNEVPLEKIPYWRAKSDGVYQQSPYLGSYFYWFNVTRKPLDNKLVRKAISLAIDRKQIVENVTRGGQLPGTMYTPPGTGGYQPPSIMPTDSSRVEEARALLAKAGYPGGKGIPPMDLLYNTHEGHKKIAEAIQEMLKKNLGVNITLRNEEWKVYLNSQRTSSFDLSRQGWIGDYNDPNTFLEMMITGNELNRGLYSNKEYDKLIEAAAKELNAKKRLTIFRKAEEILLDDLPILPIYIYTKVNLKSLEVQGWDENILDIHPLQYVSIGKNAS